MFRIFLTVVFVVFISAASAAENILPVDTVSSASAWSVSDYAKTRLISAQSTVGADDKEVLLGFEVWLKPGWKTYWRSPGEAGAPPRWRWLTAGNVLDAVVQWPFPERHSLFGLDTMVYARKVIFPIRLKLVRPGMPVKLDLQVDYFVCEQICVPLNGTYSLDIPAAKTSRPSIESGLIEAFLERVPEIVNDPYGTTSDGLSVTSVILSDSEKNMSLLIGVRSGHQLDQKNIFVEGPAELGFGTPVRIDDGYDQRFEFRIPVFGNIQKVRHLLAMHQVVITLSDDEGNAGEFHRDVLIN